MTILIINNNLDWRIWLPMAATRFSSLKEGYWMIPFPHYAPKNPMWLNISLYVYCYWLVLRQCTTLSNPIILIYIFSNPPLLGGGFYVTNGWEWGIRTPDAGFRVRSLTTWRIPNIRRYVCEGRKSVMDSSVSVPLHLANSQYKKQWYSRLREGLYRKDFFLQIYFPSLYICFSRIFRITFRIIGSSERLIGSSERLGHGCWNR